MFTNLPSFDEYSTIASPWLRALPAHWTAQRTKSLLSERVEKGYPDEPLLAATQSHGVIRKSDYGSRTVTASKDLHLLKLVEVGDFVISLRSFQGGIERCYHRGIISPAYTVLSARSGTYRDYLTYLFKSKPFIDSLSLSVTGIREGQSIDYSTLAVDILPVPPAAEQAAIVKYLAHANARIDEAIAAKRRLAVLLEEQLHGLNDRDLNDPTQVGHASARLKSLLHEVDQRSTRGDEQHLSMSQKFGLVPADRVSRTLTSESMVGGRICRQGDIVLNRLKAHLGVFAVAPSAGVVSADYTVLRILGDVLPEFLCMQLRSDSLRPELRRRTKGIVEGFWRLYTDDLLSMRVRLPDLPTQERLIRKIKTRDEEFRRVTSKIFAEITLLQEFRTRLVADVVTGQVDVSSIAATLPDAPGSFDNLPSAFDDDLEEALSEGEE
jgi:type I restriction enzyme S subunit